MRALLALAGLVGMLAGCAGLDPATPPVDQPLEPADRDLAVEISGSVTLNGSTTTDPGYHNGPFTALVDGRVNTIALLTVAPSSIPAGASNSVLAQFTAATTSYGSLPYTTNGATNYMPLYLLKSEPFGVKLYNSATSAGPLHSSAVKWDAAVRTVARFDPQEPDSDDNGATYSDRTTAPILSVGTSKTRWLFQRTAGTNQDLEDWHKLNLFAGNRYRVELTNTNGTYGTFSYDVRLVTSAGTAIVSRLGVTGNSTSFEINATVDGTFYVQVAGTPISRRGASVYFSEYTISQAKVPIPQVISVTPSGDAIGSEFAPITFSAQIAGEATSWDWWFGAGALPVTSSSANPQVTLLGPGTYSGMLTVANSAGTSHDFPFSYTVNERVFPTWASHQVTNAGFHANSIKTHGGMLILAYYDELLEDLRLAIAGPAPPHEAGDWTDYLIDGSGQYGAELDLGIVNGLPVIAYVDGGSTQLRVARAIVATPTSGSQWVKGAADLTFGSGRHPSVIENAGRIAVIYYNSLSTSLHYAQATTATPSTSEHWTRHTIDASGYGYNLSALSVGGRAAVAYNYSDGVKDPTIQLLYAHSVVATPTSSANWTVTSIIPDLGQFTVPSATLYRGVPVVGSYWTENGDYRIFKSGIAAPTLNEDWDAIASLLTVGAFCGPESLGVANGRLALGSAGSFLHVSRATIFNPEPFQSDWQTIPADSLNSGNGLDASLTEFNGQLVVSHFDSGNQKIRVTRMLSYW